MYALSNISFTFSCNIPVKSGTILSYFGDFRKNHFFVEAAVDYAFSAGLDEVSIMTKDQTLKPVLEKLGFISLGIDGDVASYTLGLEDKEKGKIRI